MHRTSITKATITIAVVPSTIQDAKSIHTAKAKPKNTIPISHFIFMLLHFCNDFTMFIEIVNDSGRYGI